MERERESSVCRGELSQITSLHLSYGGELGTMYAHTVPGSSTVHTDEVHFLRKSCPEPPLLVIC